MWNSYFFAAAGPEVKYAPDGVCYSSMITKIYSLPKPLNSDSVMKVEENVNPGGNGINNKSDNNDKWFTGWLVGNGNYNNNKRDNWENNDKDKV